jgi:hypothetical protein
VYELPFREDPSSHIFGDTVISSGARIAESPISGIFRVKLLLFSFIYMTDHTEATPLLEEGKISVNRLPIHLRTTQWRVLSCIIVFICCAVAAGPLSGFPCKLSIPLK